MHENGNPSEGIVTSAEGEANVSEVKEEPPINSPSTPRPVFMRLLMLFGGGVGCLLIGIVVSMVTGDTVLLIMSAILCVALVAKGVLLKRKINAGQIYSVSGVCVGIVPKMLNRYRRIELINTDTGDDAHFILPKKIVFKIGHVYNCYFDHQISNRPVSVNKAQGGFFNADMDLPTNGFLGFEDFGVYQEKPVTVTIAATSAEVTNAPGTEASAEESASNDAAGYPGQVLQNNENNEEVK